MLVVLLLVVVLSVAVITVLVKGNESLKAQYRAYVAASNSVYDDHADIIIGLQAQVEDLLARRDDDQAILTAKDGHIAGLVEEIKKATSVAENLEKELRVKTKEVEQARKHATELFNK